MSEPGDCGRFFQPSDSDPLIIHRFTLTDKIEAAVWVRMITYIQDEKPLFVSEVRQKCGNCVQNTKKVWVYIQAIEPCEQGYYTR